MEETIFIYLFIFVLVIRRIEYINIPWSKRLDTNASKHPSKGLCICKLHGTKGRMVEVPIMPKLSVDQIIFSELKRCLYSLKDCSVLSHELLQKFACVMNIAFFPLASPPQGKRCTNNTDMD